MTLKELSRALAPLRTRIANLVSRAVVQIVDDTIKLQRLQIGVLEGETRTEVERVQNYGFTSVPLEGAEAVVVFVGGSRDHALAVAVDDRSARLTGLQPGEVAVYTDQGDSIVIKRGGNIQITAASKVVVSAPDVELAGNTDSVALASKVAQRLSAIEGALTTWTPSPGDGGAALKAAAIAAIGTPPSVASAKVKLS